MEKLYLNIYRHNDKEKLKKVLYCVEKNTFNRKITKDVYKKIIIGTLFDIFHTIPMIY